MKLDAHVFALSITTVITAVHLICIALVLTVPGIAALLAGSILHLVTIDPTAAIEPSRMVLGLLQVVLYSYIGGWLFALIFSRSLRA